jgi:hypothetical protein
MYNEKKLQVGMLRKLACWSGGNQEAKAIQSPIHR